MFETKEEMVEFFHNKMDSQDLTTVKTFSGKNVEGRVIAVGGKNITVKTLDGPREVAIDDIAEVL